MASLYHQSILPHIQQITTLSPKQAFSCKKYMTYFLAPASKWSFSGLLYCHTGLPFPGITSLPTQTMHDYGQITQNHYTFELSFVLFDPPKIWVPLNDPWIPMPEGKYPKNIKGDCCVLGAPTTRKYLCLFV